MIVTKFLISNNVCGVLCRSWRIKENRRYNSRCEVRVKVREGKTKLKRVKRLIGSNQGLDRPIILRHKDENGQLHHHLLAGNTRATTVGYGVQAHHIDV